MTDRDRLDALHARHRTATAPPVMMGTVTHVDTDELTATVELPDGTRTDLYPTGGYLPAVGDLVPLVVNGADPISLVPRVMVDGDLQSRGFVEGEAGWRITADGDAELNDLIARGDITATRFRTAEDPTIDGSVEVTSTDGVGRIVIRAPGPLQDAPAGIWSPDDQTLDISAPDAQANIVLGYDGGVRVSAADGPITLSAPGHDVTIGGNAAGQEWSLARPPLRRRTRSPLTVPSGAPATITPNATTHHNLLADGTDSVTATGADWTPQIAGLWRLTVHATWSDPSSYHAWLGYRINAGTDVLLDHVETVGLGGAGHPTTVSTLIAFNGTDTLDLRVVQGSGTDKTFTLVQATLELVSADG